MFHPQALRPFGDWGPEFRNKAEKKGGLLDSWAVLLIVWLDINATHEHFLFYISFCFWDMAICEVKGRVSDLESKGLSLKTERPYLQLGHDQIT